MLAPQLRGCKWDEEELTGRTTFLKPQKAAGLTPAGGIYCQPLTMESYCRVEKPGKLGAKSKAAKDTTVSAEHESLAEHAREPEIESLSAEQLEDELRLFDLNPAWGPFVGIDRRQRWHRANRLNLNPPKRVLDILEMQPPRVDMQRDGGHLW